MMRKRVCAECGKPCLEPQARKLEIYSSVIQYKCSECGTELELTPAASIGVVTMVGSMVLLFLVYIMFLHGSGPGPMGLIMLGIAVVGFAYITIIPALAHWQNPPVKDAPNVDLPMEGTKDHILAHLIKRIEGFGFLGGLLAPVLFIGGGLLLAAIIGYFNYTYFGN